MKFDNICMFGAEARSLPTISASRARQAWQKRQVGRRNSLRALSQPSRNGIGWSLICTATLWVLVFGALYLAFKT